MDQRIICLAFHTGESGMLKRLFILAVLPVLVPLWLLGWIMMCAGSQYPPKTKISRERTAPTVHVEVDAERIYEECYTEVD